MSEAEKIALSSTSIFASRGVNGLADVIQAYGDQRARQAAEEMREAAAQAMNEWDVGSSTDPRFKGSDGQWLPPETIVRSLPLPPDLGERK